MVGEGGEAAGRYGVSPGLRAECSLDEDTIGVSILLCTRITYYNLYCNYIFRPICSHHQVLHKADVIKIATHNPPPIIWRYGINMLTAGLDVYRRVKVVNSLIYDPKRFVHLLLFTECRASILKLLL